MILLSINNSYQNLGTSMETIIPHLIEMGVLDLGNIDPDELRKQFMISLNSDGQCKYHGMRLTKAQLFTLWQDRE
jgi:hypothetical protein